MSRPTRSFSMPPTNVILCAECREPIPGDAGTLGLCPRCLLRRVMSTGADDDVDLESLDAPETFDAPLPDLDVLGLIGQGGMGRVYQARQRSLDRMVAIKVFHHRLARDPSFVERFGQEARVLGNLSHPHIVTAHAFGQSDSDCYLVMEWIVGPSLREVLRTGPLPAPIALGIAEQVADALAYAHARGVIHRDIKPENILLHPGHSGEMNDIAVFFETGGRVRVADFGLSKLMTRTPGDLTLTSPQHRLGTPDYMAPEQRERPRDVDCRADVYALGVVIYEMLTGELPLGRFPDPSLVSGVDARIDPVVMRCLEKDPGRRFPHAADLRRELIRVDKAIESSPPPLAYTAMPDASSRRRKALAIVLAASVASAAVLISAAGYYLQRVRYVRIQTPPVVVDVASPPTPIAATRPATLPTAAPPTSTPIDVDVDPVPTMPSGRTPASIAVQVNPADSHFPPPYRPFGPPAFANDPLADMNIRYGPTRIVTLRIDGVSSEHSKRVTARLKSLTNAASTFSSTSGDMMTIRLAPVLDVRKLADQIDFGTVKATDLATRIIDVELDPKKFPADARTEEK